MKLLFQQENAKAEAVDESIQEAIAAAVAAQLRHGGCTGCTRLKHCPLEQKQLQNLLFLRLSSPVDTKSAIAGHSTS